MIDQPTAGGALGALDPLVGEWSWTAFPQRFTGRFEDGGRRIAGRWEKAEGRVNHTTDFDLTYIRVGWQPARVSELPARWLRSPARVSEPGAKPAKAHRPDSPWSNERPGDAYAAEAVAVVGALATSAPAARSLAAPDGPPLRPAWIVDVARLAMPVSGGRSSQPGHGSGSVTSCPFVSPPACATPARAADQWLARACLGSQNTAVHAAARNPTATSSA